MKFQEMREPEPFEVRPKTLGASPRFGAAVEIAEAVAAVFQIGADDLKLRDRTKTVAEARMCFCLVARRCTRLSYPELGRFLSGRDHTTVMSGCRGAERLMARDKWFAAATGALLERFGTSEGVPIQ